MRLLLEGVSCTSSDIEDPKESDDSRPRYSRTSPTIRSENENRLFIPFPVAGNVPSARATV
jgi:hypothetical protein